MTWESGFSVALRRLSCVFFFFFFFFFGGEVLGLFVGFKFIFVSFFRFSKISRLCFSFFRFREVFFMFLTVF